MASKCGGCNLEAKGPELVACTVCVSVYHAVCAFPQHPGRTRAAKGRWECPVCIARRPRNNSDNSPARSRHNSPASASGGADTAAELITAEELAALTTNLRNFQTTFNTIKANMEKFGNSLDCCRGKVDATTRNLETLQSRIAELEERDRQREAELDTLRRRVEDLERQRDVREQAALRKEIELHGVPEEPGENLGHMVLVLASKIGIPIHETDVDSVSRVGPRMTPGGGEGERRRPRPVVIRFTRQAPREEVLKAARARRGLKSDDLSLAGPSQKIFVGERLTMVNRILFKKTREIASKRGCRYCWFRGGKILVRRRDGDRVELVASEKDLFRMFGDLTASQVDGKH